MLMRNEVVMHTESIVLLRKNAYEGYEPQVDDCACIYG